MAKNSDMHLLNKLSNECKNCKYKGIYMCTSPRKCEGSKPKESRE